MKRILSALTLSAVLASPAWAGFIDQKTTWDEMSPTQRVGYVQGMFDVHTQLFLQDTKEWEDLRKRNFKCVLDAKMTAKDLVELIDTMYRNDVAIWKDPPRNVFFQGLQKMCGSS